MVPGSYIQHLYNFWELYLQHSNPYKLYILYVSDLRMNGMLYNVYAIDIACIMCMLLFVNNIFSAVYH